MQTQIMPDNGGQTLAQKLIASAARRSRVEVGEIVTCQVDLAMFHDSSGPRRLKPMLEKLGARIWDKTRVVLVLDHYVPEHDEEARQIVQLARTWAQNEQLPHVYDSQGICHVVLPQGGHIRPGMMCVGGDSHSPTGGAFGAYMFGVGSTEMLGVVVTGEIWLRVPETIQMWWTGKLDQGVTAKDMMLHMLARFGMNGGRYQAVEFGGPVVRGLSMPERMTLSNMSAELGAQAGLIAPDRTTEAWLLEAGAQDVNVHPWYTDDGAPLTRHTFDASDLKPMVAAPHSPANATEVDAYAGTPIQVAYIGACTGAKIDDLRAAAQVLKGNRIATHVRLLVAPASVRDQEQAEREGVMGVLVDAGAQVLPTSCGACAGYGNAIGEHVNVISTTARNFKGRMGSKTANVYLASPYTVAAAAVQGKICDPREVFA